MTQQQAQQKQRLGQYPAFQAFLDYLESIPETQHEQAWKQMYGLLLPREKKTCVHCDRPAEWAETYCQDHWEDHCVEGFWGLFPGDDAL